MNVVTNILNKHLGAVHNSSPLSIVQRKVMNLLLKNAEREIHADIEHKISVRELMRGIGWSSSSKTPDNLKDCLSDLVSIKIQWNIFETDRKSKWITSTLLASAAIKDGDVYYSYSHPLRALLSQPNIYAKLDLGIQKLFKVKYSMLIWEYITGELSSKKTESITTQWLTYSQILKLTYLEKSQYENRYSQFIKRVIEKSIEEVNTKSDVEVHYETQSERGKITHIRFHAQKKGKQQLLLKYVECDNVDEIEQKLKNINLSPKAISEIKQKYSDETINNAYDYFSSEFKLNIGNIKNPIAFFKKALEEGWVLPHVIHEKMEESNIHTVEQDINHLDEPEILKTLRLYIWQVVDSAPYRAWFQETKFEITDTDLRVIAKNRFQADWIENHYRNQLLSCLHKLDPDKHRKIEFSSLDEKSHLLQ